MKKRILLLSLIFLGWLANNNSYGQEQQPNIKVFSDFYSNQGVIYTSGILGTDKNGNISDTFKEETRQVFSNLDLILEKAKSTREDVFRVTVYLSDIEMINELNEVYKQYFKAPFPVRTCVGVQGLALNAKVEVSVIASPQVN